MPLVLDGTNGVSGVDGTASNPAIEGTDSNTGIFYPAADTVAIGTGGTEALRVNSSQNVGVGTSSPGYKLDARLSGTSSGAVIQVGNTGSGGFGGLGVSDGGAYPVQMWGSALSFLTGSSIYGSATEKMRIDSSGNVGIGTSSPNIQTWRSGTYLTVANASTRGQIEIDGAVADSSSASLGALIFTYSTNTTNHKDVALIEAISSGATANQRGGVLNFYTKANGTAAPSLNMTLDSSGNVGIGTTSPSTYGKFVTYSSGGYCAIDGNGFVNSYQLLDVTTAGGRLNGGSSQGLLGSIGIEQAATGAKGGYIVFRTCPSGSNSDTERARITSGGYSKFSNDGTYANATSSYHEFRQTAADNNLVVWSTNGSLTAGIGEFDATRSANSAFTFINCFSNLSGVSDREFQLRGDGNGYADGTWNNNGADYAEFFESATGAALTLGATVVLDGNKVREATDQDPASAIMGVVRPKEPSKASMVVGNTAWNKWANKYLTDDFDRYIMEDHDVLEWIDEEGKQHSYESHNIPAGVTVPDDAVVKTHDDKGNKFQHYKLNPAWNPDAEYVNRENRPEWIIVGLVGQVKVLKGQPINDRWIKMRDVSTTVEEWMIR